MIAAASIVLFIVCSCNWWLHLEQSSQARRLTENDGEPRPPLPSLVSWRVQGSLVQYTPPSSILFSTHNRLQRLYAIEHNTFDPFEKVAHPHRFSR